MIVKAAFFLPAPFKPKLNMRAIRDRNRVVDASSSEAHQREFQCKSSLARICREKKYIYKVHIGGLILELNIWGKWMLKVGRIGTLLAGWRPQKTLAPFPSRHVLFVAPDIEIEEARARFGLGETRCRRRCANTGAVTPPP